MTGTASEFSNVAITFATFTEVFKYPMARKKSFLNRKIIDPVINFLIQGITPHKLALSLASGVIIGIFPILGTHTALTLAVIFLFRLNPAAVFLITNLVFPFFFLTAIPLLRLGEFVFGVEPLQVSISGIYEMIRTDVLITLRYFGFGLLHAFMGWLIVSIPLFLIIYYIFTPVFKNISDKLALTDASQNA